VGGPGLTCLSVGCLSIYLNFPPVPVASEQGKTRQTQAEARSPADSCAISHLTTDRVTVICAEKDVNK
jgi:hypothetical protein